MHDCLQGMCSNGLKSPDGKTIAEIRLLGSATALDVDQTTVQLRSRFFPFRHTVFAGLQYGGQLKISWLGTNELLVKCAHCKDIDVRAMERRWRGVTIEYEIN